MSNWGSYETYNMHCKIKCPPPAALNSRPGSWGWGCGPTIFDYGIARWAVLAAGVGWRLFGVLDLI